jgi:hypothetical protein
VTHIRPVGRLLAAALCASGELRGCANVVNARYAQAKTQASGVLRSEPSSAFRAHRAVALTSGTRRARAAQRGRNGFAHRLSSTVHAEHAR